MYFTYPCIFPTSCLDGLDVLHDSLDVNLSIVICINFPVNVLQTPTLPKLLSSSQYSITENSAWKWCWSMRELWEPLQLSDSNIESRVDLTKQNGWSSINSGTQTKCENLVFNNFYYYCQAHSHYFLKWQDLFIYFARLELDIYMVVSIFANFLLFLLSLQARGWLSAPQAALVSTVKSKDRYCKNWIEQSTKPSCLLAPTIYISY